LVLKRKILLVLAATLIHSEAGVVAAVTLTHSVAVAVAVALTHSVAEAVVAKGWPILSEAARSNHLQILSIINQRIVDNTAMLHDDSSMSRRPTKRLSILIKIRPTANFAVGLFS
jgi:hypothetical protein